MNIFENIENEVKKYKEEAKIDFNILNEAYEDFDEEKTDDNDIGILFDVVFNYQHKNNKIFFSPFIIEKVDNKIFINSSISNTILDNTKDLLTFLNNHRFVAKLHIKDNQKTLEVYLNYLSSIPKNSDKYEVDYKFDVINKDNMEIIINNVFQKVLYYISSRLLLHNKNNI